MKKNLISIVILALLVVNIVLSSITLLSVSGTNRKTAALVTDIAAAINLDLGGQTEEEKQEVTVSMADVVTYDITDLTVPLKKGENDEKEHYAMLSVTLSMNSKDKDYKTYGDLSARESLIKGEINDAVSQHTADEARENSHAIEEEILQRVQAMFDSQFIYDVTFSSILIQ
ncbi:MAG: flagellar basal body-associated FliL family protein [Lachnospiraceae bacterium]|nr:flagellar basal body-associated FliL family protein [Lachnospiraceae bacterium]MCI7043094.1 flagellar basal body-associated FliL family protein [Lachnospiraceae bacterium]MCI7190359.1 flagellar basal body-associated FliL family protein [Lachnospiraceae bacterium]MDD7627954.1 flagellar basal body-associated FliL family protein [Lachnospiraceae bacterium]MDY4119735.1 flagellar basal body-associated FliL family protein [Lachnospiraceae bacterium]